MPTTDDFRGFDIIVDENGKEYIRTKGGLDRQPIDPRKENLVSPEISTSEGS